MVLRRVSYRNHERRTMRTANPKGKTMKTMFGEDTTGIEFPPEREYCEYEIALAQSESAYFADLSLIMNGS